MNSNPRRPRSLEKTLDFSSVSPSTSSHSGSQKTQQASSHNSKSTSSTETTGVEYLPKFKEISAENLKTLCNSLEKVSCQKEIIPKVASTILQCRSGMMTRKVMSRSAGVKEETWLFFLGIDSEGKVRIARELASMVFRSYSNFVSIGFSESSSSSDVSSKRPRLEANRGYLERLAGAIQENAHRVFMLEDIEQVDYNSQMGILNAIKSGMVRSVNGEYVSVSDAIIILSCENFDSRSGACSPSIKQNLNSDDNKEEVSWEVEESSSTGFDLNLDAEEMDVSCDDVGLLEAVDSTFIFKYHGEL